MAVRRCRALHIAARAVRFSALHCVAPPGSICVTQAESQEMLCPPIRPAGVVPSGAPTICGGGSHTPAPRGIRIPLCGGRIDHHGHERRRIHPHDSRRLHRKTAPAHLHARHHRGPRPSVSARGPVDEHHRVRRLGDGLVGDGVAADPRRRAAGVARRRVCVSRHRLDRPPVGRLASRGTGARPVPQPREQGHPRTGPHGHSRPSDLEGLRLERAQLDRRIRAGPVRDLRVRAGRSAGSWRRCGGGRSPTRTTSTGR